MLANQLVMRLFEFNWNLTPIAALDAQAARLAGQISDAAMAQGKQSGFADVAIAALAQNARLLLLTRNLKHFEPLGVNCADPLVPLPA